MFQLGWLTEWQSRHLLAGRTRFCFDGYELLELQHVHQAGLLHRDIKPANIVAMGNSVRVVPRVKILDLGLGRFVSDVEENENNDLTRDGYSLGTVDFSAPDQIQKARAVDICANIYSLGTTLFQLICGRRTFQVRRCVRWSGWSRTRLSSGRDADRDRRNR